MSLLAQREVPVPGNMSRSLKGGGGDRPARHKHLMHRRAASGAATLGTWGQPVQDLTNSYTIGLCRRWDQLRREGEGK